MPFVSKSIYRKAVDLALKEGLDPALLDFHREKKEVTEPNEHLPIDFLYEVYEIAEAHLEAGFGLRQGMQLKSEDYGTLGLSWRTCWRARDVLNRLERFMILVTDWGEARIEEHGGLTKLIMLRDAERKGMETSNEAAFVMFAGVLEEVTNVKIKPVNVSFKHSSAVTDSFCDFFGGEVVFGESEYSIQFRTADIDIPTLKADERIQEFLVDRMEEEKKGIQEKSDLLLKEMHQLIKESLPSGIPSVIQAADYLGMSARTLKRRLSEKGLTFRDLVQQIQRDVSTDLLKNTTQSIGEIAFQTGFSEQSAFNRAFRRWMGNSPLEYRNMA